MTFNATAHQFNQIVTDYETLYKIARPVWIDEQFSPYIPRIEEQTGSNEEKASRIALEILLTFRSYIRPTDLTHTKFLVHLSDTHSTPAISATLQHIFTNRYFGTAIPDYHSKIKWEMMDYLSEAAPRESCTGVVLVGKEATPSPCILIC